MHIGRVSAALAALAERQVASPLGDFVRSSGQSSVALGNNLYVVGGEIARRVNGQLDQQNPSKYIDSTLVIPLSTSWSASNVTITSIPNTANAPARVHPSLWADATSASLYMYGGDSPMRRDIPNMSTLWRFSTFDQSWTRVGPANDPSGFAARLNPAYASFAAAGDTAYVMGGWTSATSDSRATVTTPQQGLLEYNMTSQAWRVRPAIELAPFGTQMAGSQVYIPYGNKGILMFLGGYHAVRPESADEGWNGEGMLSFKNISMFDVGTGSWFSQQTSGDIPSERNLLCASGVEGANGTYEVFVYGGYNGKTQTAFDDVYVLSLPGFHWFKANYKSFSPRATQTCTSSNGQIISVGGYDFGRGFPAYWQLADPFQNGINVFDMRTMSWTGQYVADAPPYEGNEMVRQWYAEGNLGMVYWTSGSVRELFTRKQLTLSSSSPQRQNPAAGIPLEAIMGAVFASLVIFAIALAIILVYFNHRKHRSLVVGADKPTRRLMIPLKLQEPWK